MTAAATVGSKFDMGRVAGRTFGAISRNLVVFVLLALAVAGVPEAIARYFNQTAAAGAGAGAYLISIVAGLIGFLGACVLQAAIIHGTIADLNGRKAGFEECVSTGWRFLLPVIGVSILTGLAVGFGILLLIVPGVLMALAWCMNVPVVVVERKSVMQAFERSADLTRGHRLPIFGLMVAYVLVVWIVDALGVALTSGFSLASLVRGGGFNGPEWILLTLLQIAQSMIAAAGVAAIYYELRSIKEGIGPEALASVFD